MNIGVTGTRYGCQIDQHLSLINVLRTFRQVYGEVTFHHGDCLGADQEAALIAQGLRFWVVGHPPSNPKHRGFFNSDHTHPEKDYHTRDRDIVDDSDVLIACPDGPERPRSGTWYTVNYARKIDKPIFIIYPDGEVVTENASK